MHKPIIFSDLTAEQARQLIDCRQIFDAQRHAMLEARRRFSGSMEWRGDSSHQYLYRRQGRVAKSLGVRSPETEQAYAAFTHGRQANDDRIAGLTATLEAMAPVNRALGLGRVPNLVARILRRIDQHDLLGERVALVGTNALFAYEAAAGVQMRSGLLATGDMDLAVDARRGMAVVARMPAEGLMGLLRRVDRSFALPHPGHYSAVNRDGFMVDLITPATRDMLRRPSRVVMSADADDVSAVDLPKLQWLVEAPRFEVTAIAQNGLPVWLSVADPRFFAAHKLWLADREDRSRDKRLRDQQQAAAVASLLSARLPLSLDDRALSPLPPPLRDRLRALVHSAPEEPAPAW